MTYSIYLDQDYAGEAATVSGWGDFIRWGQKIEQAPGLAHLVQYGWADGLHALQAELTGVKPTPKVAGIRQALLDALGKSGDHKRILVADFPPEDDDTAGGSKKNGRIVLRGLAPAELKSYVLRKLIQHTEPLEEPFKATLRALFDRQEAAVKKSLSKWHKSALAQFTRGDDADDDAEDILGDEEEFGDEWNPAFSAGARPHFADAADAGGEHAMDIVGGPTFSRDTKAVQDMLLDREQRFAEEVSETTWNALKASFVEGIQAGENLSLMEDRIAETMDLARGFRTQNIARTEIVGVFNKASAEGYRQADVERKGWATASDDRVRDEHYDLEDLYGDEKDAIPMDDEFEYDGMTADCPGDWGDPGMDCQCRCALVPYMGGTSDDDSDDEDRSLRGTVIERMVAARYGREFNEDDHPRDDHGRFGSGNGPANSEGTPSPRSQLSDIGVRVVAQSFHTDLNGVTVKIVEMGSLGNFEAGGKLFDKGGHYDDVNKEIVSVAQPGVLAHEMGHSDFHFAMDRARNGLLGACKRAEDSGLPMFSVNGKPSLLDTDGRIRDPQTTNERLFNAFQDYKEAHYNNYATDYAASWGKESIMDRTPPVRFNDPTDPTNNDGKGYGIEVAAPRSTNESYAEYSKGFSNDRLLKAGILDKNEVAGNQLQDMDGKAGREAYMNLRKAIDAAAKEYAKL